MESQGEREGKAREKWKQVSVSVSFALKIDSRFKKLQSSSE